jgi:hypothetical protein
VHTESLRLRPAKKAGVLITNELVSNAIGHACTPCRVTMRLTALTVQVFVPDGTAQAIPEGAEQVEARSKVPRQPSKTIAAHTDPAPAAA